MTVRLTPPAAPRALPLLRRPHDYVAVLLVTAGAYQTVSNRLDGAVTVTKVDDGALGAPRYRIDPRSGIKDGPAGLLTVRELEVLAGAALGKTNAEIGNGLHLSVETVRTHMKHILRKFDAIDRAHAVHIGHLLGYLGGAA
jgi:DNA-binding CsgD family transcriptional regulator